MTIWPALFSKQNFLKRRHGLPFLNRRSEPAPAYCRFGGMDTPDVLFHTAVLVLAALGILLSLAGIAFWWVSRNMNRLT